MNSREYWLHYDGYLIALAMNGVYDADYCDYYASVGLIILPARSASIETEG